MKVPGIILPHSQSSGRNLLICFVFFAVTDGLLVGTGVALASRKCYYCVWVALEPGDQKLVPSALNKSDVCRPGNFDSRIVHVETCQSDCITLILYDYVENDHLNFTILGKLPRGFLPSRNSSFKEYDPKRTVVMSSFYRGCSEQSELKRHGFCHDYTEPNDRGMHVFQQTCFCSSPLCNGNIKPQSANSGVTQLGTVATFWVLPLFVFLTRFW